MNCLVLTADFGEKDRGGLIGEELVWFSLTAGGGPPLYLVYRYMCHWCNNGTVYKEEGGRVRVTWVSLGLSPRGLGLGLEEGEGWRRLHFAQVAVLCQFFMLEDTS